MRSPIAISSDHFPRVNQRWSATRSPSRVLTSRNSSVLFSWPWDRFIPNRSTVRVAEALTLALCQLRAFAHGEREYPTGALRAQPLEARLNDEAANTGTMTGNLLASVVLLAQLASTNAPGDEYFGRLKMSALRVRYETMQLKSRYEGHRLLPEQTEHLLLLTENSFDQWAARYPKDRWLASTGFLIASLYAELPGSVAREHAVMLYVFVKSHFPDSSYAASSRAALHRGVPTKADPSWAKEMRAASPSASPAASPSAVPSAAPSASPSAAPRGSPCPR